MSIPQPAHRRLIALGVLEDPDELVVLMVAIVLSAALALGVNRSAGVPYPWWSARPDRPGSSG